jgi:hypothetical protein
MRKLSFVLAAALALPLQSPSVAQAPAPFDLESVQPIVGSWSYRTIAGGSEANFIDTAPRLIIRCNRAARTVSIIRTGVPAATATASIWTTSTARTIPARFLATKELVADFAATDPLLDAIAFSRGRFATAASGAPLLVLPAWPETARVIEDCRS